VTAGLRCVVPVAATPQALPHRATKPPRVLRVYGSVKRAQRG
jgi:hypothetical protein